MRCPGTEDIALYFAGILEAGFRETLDRHLKRCARCRAEFEGLVELAETLKQDKAWEKPSDETMRKIVGIFPPREARAPESMRRPWRSPGFLLPAGATRVHENDQTVPPADRSVRAVGQKGTIRGQIFAGDDVSFEESKVFLVGPEGQVAATSKADEHGRFKFDQVGVGDYAIVVDLGDCFLTSHLTVSESE